MKKTSVAIFVLDRERSHYDWLNDCRDHLINIAFEADFTPGRLDYLYGKYCWWRDSTRMPRRDWAALKHELRRSATATNQKDETIT